MKSTPLLAPFAAAAATALLLGALPAAAWAESSAVSSASNSASSTASSASNSLEQSSDSSSGGKKVAAGEYKVIEMAALPTQPDTLRVRLQATAEGAAEFVLLLPRAAAEKGAVARGQVLTVAEREYGYAFANKAQQQPFFLVLEDAWFRELQSRPV